MPDTEQQVRALLAAATEDVPAGIDLLRGVRARRPAPRARVRAGLAAAAAAVVVSAATLTLTLAQAPSALAQLTSAISRTTGHSYHFNATTTRVLGTGDGMPPATRTAFSGAFDPAAATGEETFSTGAQIRFTGGYVYLNPGRIPAGQPGLPGGKSWLGVPSPAFGVPASASPQLRLLAGMLGAAGTSPQGLFSLLRSVSTVTSQGSVPGSGWTRYAFSGTFALGPAGSGPATATAAGTVDVDQQGRVRHLDATWALHATPPAQPERVTIEMSFSDFGAPVRVSAPPAGDVFMP